MPIQFDPDTAPLASLKPRVAVFRYDGSGTFTLLPHVRCLRVEEHEGAHPGSAHFRYAFDPDFLDTPTRFETVFPITAVDPAIVNPDDQLVVALFDYDGNYRFLFHGFACAPQADLGRHHEAVTFQALGVAQREWDDVLNGSYVRGADDVTDGDDILIDFPGRFNPDGKGNAIPEDAELAADDSGFQYPSFLDSAFIASKGTDGDHDGLYEDTAGTVVGRKWTLEMAARYLMTTGNQAQQWVKLPPWQSVRDLLVAQQPKGAAYDPDDSSTYDVKPIFVRDYHPHGKAWPEALHELIAPHGFGMRFALQGDADGKPTTRLMLWRRGAGRQRRKRLYLQVPGSELDPASSNLSAMKVQRDSPRIVNVVRVETAVDRCEAGFVLAPGFAVDGSDTSDAEKVKFKKTSPDFKDNSDKYRLFVFDECGEGHWEGMAWTTGAPGDFSPILGDASQDATAWVVRRRPGGKKLFSKGEDSQGKKTQPLEATLSISFDYAAGVPAVWDGSGTWRTIKGSWDLCKDRLGIRITCEDPNAFHLGGPGTEGGKKGGEVARLVEWLAGTPPNYYYLRLTAVIEGDRMSEAVAQRRSSSPSPYDVVQTIDAKDRFAVEIVHHSSEFNETGAGISVRDDVTEAKAEAYARQRATEIPPLAGHVTIPKLVLSYEVGDRLVTIEGRNASLQTNSGTGAGVAPTYPEVVGRSWHLDGDHATELMLDDHRIEVMGHGRHR